MKHSTPLLEKAPIGHLVRQGMRERVFRLGEQTRFVQECRHVQRRQATG